MDRRVGECFDEALRARPGMAEAAMMRARVLERLGRRNDALLQWKAMGEQPGPLLQVARLEAELGHRGKARDALERAIRIGGDRVRTAAAKSPALAGLLR